MAAMDEARAAGHFARELGEAVLRAAGADGYFPCGWDGRIGACNAAAARFLRAVPARAPGSDLRKLLARLDDETLELRFAGALRDRELTEFVVGRPGGADEWAEVRGVPLSAGMVFFLRDVTDRERSERELRRKERRLRATNDSLRLAHQVARAATWEWRVGERLRWLDLSAARALVGLSGEQADDESIADWRSFVIAEDMPVVAEMLRTLREHDSAEFEYRVAGADGRRWLRSNAAVVERRVDGGPARIVGVTLDVTPHKQAEAKLQREIQERLRAERRQQLLIHELNHRVKNMLATVQSVARQSLGRARDDGPLADFENRLMALAWAHDVLTKERWAGASLTTILTRTLSPHAEPERVSLEGPDLRVSPKMALALAMGAHELAINAVKHGALSNEAGRVRVRWSVEADRLVLDWQERGGPAVTPPTARGFGSRLLERGLAHELGGEVGLAFEPAGLRCRISAPYQAEAVEESDAPMGLPGLEPPRMAH
jgi:two-component sensor histidine kinase